MAKEKRAAPPGSVRIIGGRWRGRRLRIPEGADVRPTPDRARETLFNWLAPIIDGARCLDLYAGTGALGFEALSRGASEACFVERDGQLAEALRAHAAALGASVVIAQADAQRWLAQAAARRYDVVFLDPPYALPVEPLLARLASAAPGALVYVERPLGAGLPTFSEGAEWTRQSRAGAVVYGLLRLPVRAGAPGGDRA